MATLADRLLASTTRERVYLDTADPDELAALRRAGHARVIWGPGEPWVSLTRRGRVQLTDRPLAQTVGERR